MFANHRKLNNLVAIVDCNRNTADCRGIDKVLRINPSSKNGDLDLRQGVPSQIKKILANCAG
jgi:hypothetical protein